jgi:hypothetical protein
MRRLVTLLAALAVVAAGCGGGGGGGPSGKPLTKAEYQAKLEQTSKEIGTQLGPQSEDFSKLTDKDVGKLVDALHSFADKLQEINPPAEVKALHARLIGAMNDLADEFPDIASKLKSTKDPSAAIAALFGAKGIQELVKLGDDFKKAGYDLNLNG